MPGVVEAGGDILVIQSTVTSARHISKSYRGLILTDLCEQMKIPVVVGNCVSFNACLELMRTGIAGVLVGVGPGYESTRVGSVCKYCALQKTCWRRRQDPL